MKPAAEEADVAWAGLHTLRHTFASLHIDRGTNVVQLSKLLGHHSPAFTLTVYADLLNDDVGEALDLDAELVVDSPVHNSSAPDASPMAMSEGTAGRPGTAPSLESCAAGDAGSHDPGDATRDARSPDVSSPAVDGATPALSRSAVSSSHVPHGRRWRAEDD